jgi:hypothetical protein
MAVSDEDWVQDKVSAVADIRAYTAGMNFESFAAKSATPFDRASLTTCDLFSRQGM